MAGRPAPSTRVLLLLLLRASVRFGVREAPSNAANWLCGCSNWAGRQAMSNLNSDSTMLDIVMVAFESVGGEAEFARVYPVVKRIFRELQRTEPDELEAQVRQTVYLFCPESPNYLNQGF